MSEREGKTGSSIFKNISKIIGFIVFIAILGFLLVGLHNMDQFEFIKIKEASQRS